jgi:hypothetical protein
VRQPSSATITAPCCRSAGIPRLAPWRESQPRLPGAGRADATTGLVDLHAADQGQNQPAARGRVHHWAR